eukprot:TRINITY_DN49218_c0_g1_i2.p2 TRINITY_DN49218_c0_g1~~TRINITY_DN49218_c0_g1_i2.p2  ORF type:complete len:139 (-),score=22.66 TRINITY_DN49218_c0_g1_i2:4-420(-)
MKFYKIISIVFLDQQVLKFDENNLKALYRRGISQMKKYNFGEAKQDLYLAKQLDPEDKQIDEAIKQLTKQLQQQKAREKLMSEKMLKGYQSEEKSKSYFQTKREKIQLSISSALSVVKAQFQKIFKFCKRRDNTKKQI